MKYQQYQTFHPTFLYESIWDVGVAVVVLWADRRFRLGHGRAFALYVMAYTAGRGWIEYLRIDTANHIFGVRLNVWTSIILFVLATATSWSSAGAIPAARATSWRRSPGASPEARDRAADDIDDRRQTSRTTPSTSRKPDGSREATPP